MSIVWLSTVGALLVAARAQAGDWPAFRGADGRGLAGDASVPLHWAPDSNIRWKQPLPGPGNSSPIVSGDRVFVTCAADEGRQRGLYCFDRRTGEPLWHDVVLYKQPDPTHKTNPYCGSSPAADGKRVVVWHGSAGVHCYDYEGRKLWSRDLGLFTHIWGYGSSPVFHGEKVILNCGPGPRTFVTALGAAKGNTLWQVDEPGGKTGEKGASEWIGSWSTPVVARVDGEDQILVSLPLHVQAYRPADGKILWSCAGLGDLVYTSPVLGDGGTVAIAMGGYQGPAIGFRLGGSGDVTEANRLWRDAGKNPQRIGSGIVVGKHLFMANEKNLAQCIEVETGKEVWSTRLPQGDIWASLVLAGDRLYVTNQRGNTIVFRANPEKLEVLAQNSLDESSNSTLAIADHEIFLRTFQNLYCIAED